MRSPESSMQGLKSSVQDSSYAEYTTYLDQSEVDEPILALEQVEDALCWSEVRYRQIMETTMEGIWVIDASNRITFVNQMMADILGYKINEMMGKSIFEDYHLQLVNLCDDPNVCLDTKLLRHILCNLLTNAIKYSPYDRTIQLEVLREDRKVIFQVQDEGIGIP